MSSSCPATAIVPASCSAPAHARKRMLSNPSECTRWSKPYLCVSGSPARSRIPPEWRRAAGRWRCTQPCDEPQLRWRPAARHAASPARTRPERHLRRVPAPVAALSTGYFAAAPMHLACTALLSPGTRSACQGRRKPSRTRKKRPRAPGGWSARRSRLSTSSNRSAASIIAAQVQALDAASPVARLS
jgi:hypothetical protein